jgi:hypothetical protein
MLKQAGAGCNLTAGKAVIGRKVVLPAATEWRIGRAGLVLSIIQSSFHLMRYPSLGLLLATLVLLVSCDEVCEKDKLPQYNLSTGQREWAAAYAENTVLRFHNASGYERRYRVSKVSDESEGKGGGKSSFCPNYYVQTLTASIERTDSTGIPLTLQQFGATGQNLGPNESYNAGLSWGGAYFSLPIGEVESGQPLPAGDCRLLPQATFAGRTYNNVLEGTVNSFYAMSLPPTGVLRIFITKADGVIRFETKAGTIWDRVW